MLRVIKTELFLNLFFIPCGIRFLISLIFFTFGKTTSFLQVLINIAVHNLSFSIPWFIISFLIVFTLINRRENYREGINDDNANILVKCFRRAKFPFIMSILCFLIGLLFFYDSLYFNLKVKLIAILYGFAPCVMYTIVTFLITRFYNKIVFKNFLKFVIVFMTLGVIPYYFMAAHMCSVSEGENPITDIKNYEKIVKRENLLKVFLEKIPNNVENIEFYYSLEGYLGETKCFLYYVDKDMNKEKFDNKYKDKAIWIGIKNEYNMYDGLLEKVFSYTPVNNAKEDDFVIYLIFEGCIECGNCNSSNFLLTAFNEQTNEVIYFARQ